MEGCAELFSNEEYEERQVEVGGGSTRLRLLSSTAATTDYDLTGQMLWPAATLLAEFLAVHLRAHPRPYRACCELGAGVGLPGLLAAQSCPVLLTDHSEVVLRVLRRNAALNRASLAHEPRCLQLDWGSAADRRNALDLSPDAKGFDLLIAADVCYSLNSLAPLFQCAAALLARQPQAAFFLGYVCRWANVDRAVVPAAQAAGFAVAEEPLEALPEGSRALPGKVFRLTHGQPGS